jgi:dGTP triphosphohydrolase
MDSYLYSIKREEYLASYATFSSEAIFNSTFSEDDQSLISKSPFERDKEFILHSAALRKLGSKSQNLVFRTLADASSRLSHTLQVTDIASKIAQGLRLNIDLTEAIALGHDLGHMPFSHNMQNGINNLLIKEFVTTPNANNYPILNSVYNEQVRNELRQFFYLGNNDNVIFAHQKQSFHVLHSLEPDATNRLTVNTQVGILHNYDTKRLGVFGDEVESRAISYEMMVVELADLITWVNNDFDEAIKKGFIVAEEFYNIKIKGSYSTIGDLGLKYDERISKFIQDVVEYNTTHQHLEKNGCLKGQTICPSPTFFSALKILKDFFMEKVLESKRIISRAKLIQLLAQKLLAGESNTIDSSEVKMPSIYREACDKIWQMSDYDVITRARELGIPEVDVLLELIGTK